MSPAALTVRLPVRAALSVGLAAASAAGLGLLLRRAQKRRVVGVNGFDDVDEEDTAALRAEGTPLDRPADHATLYLNLHGSGMFHVVTTVLFQGCVPPERVRKAVHLLGQRHPTLRMGFTLESNGKFWLRDLGTPIHFEVLELGTSWQEHHEALANVSPFHTPVEGKPCPAMFVYVLPGASGDCTAVQLALHHAVADGISAMAAIGDLKSFLGSLAEVTGSTGSGSTTVEELMPLTYTELKARLRPVAASALRLLYTRAVTAVARALQPVWRFGLDDAPGLAGGRSRAGSTPVGPGKLRILPFSLSEEETQALIGMSRANGVTVNSAVTAAQKLAVMDLAQRLEEETPMSMRIASGHAVNTRRFMATPLPAPAMYNQASLAVVSAVLTPGADLWSVARDVNRSLHGQLAHGAQLLAANAVGVDTRTTVDQLLGRENPNHAALGLLFRDCPVVISNVGAHCLPSQGPAVVGVHLGAAVPLFLFTTLVTVDTRLDLTVEYCSNALPEDAANAFVAAFKAHLRRAIARPEKVKNNMVEDKAVVEKVEVPRQAAAGAA